MAMGSPETHTQAALDELLSTLPACRRCRLNKRRCDTELPSCHNCSKVGVECIFYDHVRKEDISRSYIASLVRELQRAYSHAAHTEATPAIPFTHYRMGPLPEILPLKTSRYIGGRACLAQNQPLNELVATPPECPPPTAEVPVLNIHQGLIITPEIHHFLVEVYLTRINSLFPFLDKTSAPFIPAPSFATHVDSWQEFMIHLIYSIASHCVDQEGYRKLADECYKRAIQHLDQATADTNVAALQAITLLALYSFFKPHDGNTGQLIGFAARLAMDVERHGSQDQQPIIQRSYNSIYCMENQFNTALDRPGLLPEPPDPMQFDVTRPEELVCSLYRIQSRFRSSDRNALILLLQNFPVSDPAWNYIEKSMHPNVLSVVYETHLLIEPSPEVAYRLLSCYTHRGYIPTFLTPQWAYKAGMMLFGDNTGPTQLSNEHLLEAYSKCALIFERCSRYWPSSQGLGQIIRSCLNRKGYGAQAA
ncbi:hypothetical protein F5884DRAFT_793430 [Xylogone sp. PMI_703]|nr:hypothetical protein F5884DRAFT_793430 [Xylogone sp. PMI_703]